MLEPVIHEDRIKGAASLKGSDPKSVAVRKRILAGQCDDHPSVRCHADAREFNRLTPVQRLELERRFR